MKWRNRISLLSDELARLRALEPAELLGVTSHATLDEIKMAFRKMVIVYHPDKAAPFMKNYNEQVLKLIIDAYKILLGRAKGRND